MSTLGGNKKVEDFSTTEETRFDWALLLTMAIIIAIGVLNIYSASQNLAKIEHTNFAFKQAIFAVGGFALIGVIMIFDYRIIERFAWVLYGLNMIALLLVPFIGHVRYGARRWLDIGHIMYQPSESMKIICIFALAKYFHTKDTVKKMDFKDLFVPLLILGVPALITITQPDLGTGGNIAIIGTIMLLFAGVRTRVLVTGLLVAIISFPIAWEYGLKPYQQDRIRTFIDPMSDPKGDGYNALQSMIAVGSGQIAGKGYMKGTQTQLDYTPEGHTDFIFTVLAEEWGLLGSLTLFALYIILFYRCINIAASARDKFGSMVGVGIIGMLASQSLINLLMVTGLFPIVGIPLPLVSYGGTSIMTVSLALGTLLNIGYRRTLF